MTLSDWCCDLLFLQKLFLYQKETFLQPSYSPCFSFYYLMVSFSVSSFSFESYIITVFPAYLFIYFKFFYYSRRYRTLLVTMILLLCLKFYYIISVHTLYVGNYERGCIPEYSHMYLNIYF